MSNALIHVRGEINSNSLHFLDIISRFNRKKNLACWSIVYARDRDR